MSRIIKSPKLSETAPDFRMIPIRSLGTEENRSEYQEMLNQSELDRFVQDAEGKAREIIAEAEEKADEIRRQIQVEQEQWQMVERKRLEELARETGFEEGFFMGKQKGMEMADANIQEAKRILHQAETDYELYIESSEKVILQLSSAIAEKILAVEIERNPERFVSLVKAAIKEVKGSSHVHVRVHPNQYRTLSARKPELQALFPYETVIRIFPDEGLSETDCMLETPSGRVDAGIESQLEEIFTKLTELLEGEQ
ncbi:MAG: flagellar assembly protein FliH [Bacillus sp. (in: firmicutes)]